MHATGRSLSSESKGSGTLVGCVVCWESTTVASVPVMLSFVS